MNNDPLRDLKRIQKLIKESFNPLDRYKLSIKEFYDPISEFATKSPLINALEKQQEFIINLFPTIHRETLFLQNERMLGVLDQLKQSSYFELAVPKLVHSELGQLFETFQDLISENSVTMLDEDDDSDDIVVPTGQPDVDNKNISWVQLITLIFAFIQLLSSLEASIQTEKQHTELIEQSERQHHELINQNDKHQQELLEQNERYFQEKLDALNNFMDLLDSHLPDDQETSESEE